MPLYEARYIQYTIIYVDDTAVAAKSKSLVDDLIASLEKSDGI
jgi:hypothetical protein